MTLLGLGKSVAEDAADEVLEHTRLRAELIKRFVLGGGTSVGIAIVLGAFELLHNEPHDAFPLLTAWGPWCIVTVFAIYVIYDVLKTVINLIRAVGMRVAGAIEKLASAQQQQADKDDRQYDRMITLTTYGNTRADRLHERMDESDEALHRYQEQLAGKMDRLFDAVTAKRSERRETDGG